MLYFAYGANLNKRGMKMRCPQAKPVGLAILADYRLCFKRWADIVPAKDRRVHGALWEITPACLRALDDYEGADYRQIKISVEHDGTVMQATAYAMHTQAPFAPPEMEYYREIAVGYRDWSLDEQLLRRARYDTLNVGPGALQNAPAPAPSSPDATVLPPRRRALWDPAANATGAIDNLIISGAVKRKPT